MTWKVRLEKLKLRVGYWLARAKCLRHTWEDQLRHYQYTRGFNRAMQLGFIEGYDTDVVAKVLKRKEPEHGPPCSFNVGVEVACDLLENIRLMDKSKDVVDQALETVQQELKHGVRA